MNTTPLISVIMPVYNGARWLDQSIPSLLNQTLRAFELIVVDDCSTDATPEIIRHYASQDQRVIQRRNNTRLDHVVCRNLGLAQARGQYVAELDADDIALPERLAVQYQYLEDHPELALIGGGVEVINEQGVVTGRKRPPQSFALLKYRLLLRNPFVHSAIFYRRDAARAVGGYDTGYLHAEDYWLYYSLIQNGQRLGNVPEIIIQYRAHPQSISTSRPTRAIQLANVYRINQQWLKPYLPAKPTLVKTVIDTIHRRRSDWPAVIRSLRFCQKLTATYLRREAPPPADRAAIIRLYQAEKERLLGQLCRTHWPAFYNLAKRTYRAVGRYGISGLLARAPGWLARRLKQLGHYPTRWSRFGISVARWQKFQQQHELNFWTKLKQQAPEQFSAYRETFFQTNKNRFCGLRLDFSGGTAVDVGCGPFGGLLPFVEARQKIGVDPLLPEYQRLYGGQTGIRWVASPAETLPLASASADACYCINMLDHTARPYQVLDEVYRLLKPGGYLAFCADVGGTKKHPIKLYRQDLDAWFAHHPFRVTEQSCSAEKSTWGAEAGVPLYIFQGYKL